jgi:ribonucleotide reductase beta subunit family protein with ferritin-like domain
MSTNLTTASLEELNVSVTDRKQETEPILIENKDRFVLFPIKHPEIWNMYKQSEQSFWTAEEIDLSSDFADWDNKLSADETFCKTCFSIFCC